MSTAKKHKPVAAKVRSRVMRGGDRLWRADDFSDLPAVAVMRSLSRLAQRGDLRRVAKGVYHRPEHWLLGETKPTRSAVVASAARTAMHPAGLTAANALGLTTQNTALPEVAVTGTRAPSVLDSRAFVRTRRPSARERLTNPEVAILEVLRDRAATSDLSPDETIERLRHLLTVEATFTRLARAAEAEPPRVRAMLGALGEVAGVSIGTLSRLRGTLNPVSRFDFGVLSRLPNARSWQAKAVRR